MRRRNAAIERSKLAQKARPLGEFIVQALHAKTTGIPRLPKIEIQSKRKQTACKTHAQHETSILHDCLHWLYQQGVKAWRQNTGTVWLGDKRPISYGYPGSGDITGILPDGRRLEIECKSPTGRQSAKQKKFQRMIEENNGVYLLVRSVKELEEAWKSL